MRRMCAANAEAASQRAARAIVTVVYKQSWSERCERTGLYCFIYLTLTEEDCRAEPLRCTILSVRHRLHCMYHSLLQL